MATKARMMQRVAALGCSVDEMDAGFNVDTPTGKLFNATSTHTLAYYYRGWTRPDLYDAVLADLAAGVADCEGECDLCRPGEEEAAG